ncbi:MAG: ATP-binding protein [Methylohalobius sp.]|nr:ATP-binding protein [Methylohalobius sp.]
MPLCSALTSAFKRFSLHRSLLLAVGLLFCLLVAVLAALGYLSWRDLERVHNLQQLAELDGREPLHLQAQLAKIVSDMQIELEGSIAGTIALLILFTLGTLAARTWLFIPLSYLNDLLLRLAEGDFEPISAKAPPPPWDRLIANYNDLVRRLSELEAAHLARARSLEKQVRAAASALLSQSQNLARAERLAALGEMAASLAHELRNPLAGIQVALHNLRAECADPALKPRVDLILAEIERLNRYLNRLLDQARHQPEPLQKIDLDRTVREVLELVRYQLPEGIRLHYQPCEEKQAWLPETGLRQALINLLLNAAQALGTAGNIWIEIGCTEERLALRISDDGPGFPAELLKIGIRPFATGKDNGTGLGLLMVKRFVQSLDGHFKLSQMQPHGACVTLEIPCKPPC